ncbi:MAG TPA: TIGR00266 family protein, partial [Desulfobacteraceae bacterium]|nr:TIGR00266 family protein [Desulfobacteraceae bacterium]
MSQWYLSYDGNQIGPLDKARAMAQAQKNPNGHAWREGFAEWLPISQIAELSSSGISIPEPPTITSASADEIDFKIYGSEMQFVEVELDP